VTPVGSASQALSTVTGGAGCAGPTPSTGEGAGVSLNSDSPMFASRPDWPRGDQARNDRTVPKIATKTTDSRVTRKVTKMLTMPQTRGWMCHGLLPVRRLYAFERMNASIRTRGPK